MNGPGSHSRKRMRQGRGGESFLVQVDGKMRKPLKTLSASEPW